MAVADSDSDSEWSFIKYLADDLSAVPRASDIYACTLIYIVSFWSMRAL